MILSARLAALFRPSPAPLLRLWRRRAATRRQLSRLSAWQLADLGLAPDAAEREARLPFWR
ncbi:DUF1127 domain-containing protein [Poseidonocella sp. HB161398]|uniref:DUF1127 domain-containing protein n=1 Tax=Poseidonocella sp. HB161398 TaxID=2320855 RepID=UPI001109CE54|nr:DUF1127 domain-containing protein [Poseidonocella sp. HB161398]